jgi:prophage tail gpP-like protein
MRNAGGSKHHRFSHEKRNKAAHCLQCSALFHHFNNSDSSVVHVAGMVAASITLQAIL